MAGGMLTKQADFLTAQKLNQVNDAASGGVVLSVPAGAPSPYVSQTTPGDRIVLDDATALALSSTAIGTLYGGVYMYVGTTLTATAAPARGLIAFWPTANLPNGATPQYVCSSDAAPTATIPAYIAGVFINAITKGNFGWIQCAGTASVQFDGAFSNSTALGTTVSAKSNPTNPSTADSNVTLTSTTLAYVLGVAVGTPITSAISAVIITRGNFCGRI